MLSVHYRTTLPAIPPERSHAKHTLFLLAQISCISFAIGANPFVLFDYWRKWLMSLFAIGLCHGKHTLFLLAQIACISIAIGAAMGSILSSYWPLSLASLSLSVLPWQEYSLPIGPNCLHLYSYWCYAMPSILSSYFPKSYDSLSLLVLPWQEYSLPIGPNHLNLFGYCGAMPWQAYSLPIGPNILLLFRYWYCQGKHTIFLLAQIIWISFAIGAAMASIFSSY